MHFCRFAICALIPPLVSLCTIAHSQNIVCDGMLRVDAYSDRIDEQHREAARLGERQLDDRREEAHRHDERREEQWLTEKNREEQINGYDAWLRRQQQTRSRTTTTP